MGFCLDDESRIQQIFCQASSRPQAPALTDEVLKEIAGIPCAHGDPRLENLLVNDTALRMLGKTAGGELGGILRQLNPRALGDQDGCNIETLEEFIAQSVIGEILFRDKPLTPVKAGILATVTTPGDPRVREIVKQGLGKGGFNWAIVQALQI